MTLTAWIIAANVALDAAVVGAMALLMKRAARWGTGPGERRQMAIRRALFAHRAHRTRVDGLVLGR
ncbi:MAG: hypothetical protein ABSC56_03125 [Solirubrobacteraceae bacterium]|jgi:hypothetical protein